MLLKDNSCNEIEVRQEIINFAIRMEKVMKANDRGKGDSYKSMEIESLIDLKFEKDGEVEDELLEDTIDLELLVDQSNYNMMLYHRISNGGL